LKFRLAQSIRITLLGSLLEDCPWKKNTSVPVDLIINFPVEKIQIGYTAAGSAASSISCKLDNSANYYIINDNIECIKFIRFHLPKFSN
jgi:hypothetical protein